MQLKQMNVRVTKQTYRFITNMQKHGEMQSGRKPSQGEVIDTFSEYYKQMFKSNV